MTKKIEPWQMSMPKVALLDGDMVAHRAAFVADSVSDLPFTIRHIVKAWTPEGTTAKIALSCSREENKRREYYPDYKAHRDNQKVDEAQVERLEAAKKLLGEELWEAKFVPGLEADDLMGIAASAGKAVAVTLDKDLLSTPGWHYRPEHTYWGGADENGVRMQVTKPAALIRQSVFDADLMFHMQWLMGDMTDNYPGLKGVGPKKAEKLLAHTRPENWEALVCSTYEKAGHDGEYTLAMARCARILRVQDWEAGGVYTPEIFACTK